MKTNYIYIPLVTIAVAIIGSSFTTPSIAGWYRSIHLPAWTPPGSVIGLVWTTIFILSAASALILWNGPGSKAKLPLIAGLFLLNAVLNVLWSYLFFSLHLIGPAIGEAAALDASVIALVLISWPISRLASALLMPYAAWGAFATYLTYTVWQLNR